MRISLNIVRLRDRARSWWQHGGLDDGTLCLVIL